LATTSFGFDCIVSMNEYLKKIDRIEGDYAITHLVRRRVGEERVKRDRWNEI